MSGDPIDEEARRFVRAWNAARESQMVEFFAEAIRRGKVIGMRIEREAALTMILDQEGETLVYQSIQLADHHPSGDPAKE